MLLFIISIIHFPNSLALSKMSPSNFPWVEEQKNCSCGYEQYCARPLPFTKPVQCVYSGIAPSEINAFLANPKEFASKRENFALFPLYVLLGILIALQARSNKIFSIYFTTFQICQLFFCLLGWHANYTKAQNRPSRRNKNPPHQRQHPDIGKFYGQNKKIKSCHYRNARIWAFDR